MTDRIKAGLRGPVESCLTEQTLFVHRCGPDGCDAKPEERHFSTLERYHADGRIAEQRHCNPDGSEWTSLYRYSAAGILQEIEVHNATGPASKKIYHYAQNGRLECIVAQMSDGAERTEESISYDEAGRTSKAFHVDPNLVREDAAFASGIEGSDSAYSSAGATTIVTVYDERDKPVGMLFYDDRDRLLSRVTLRYDEQGRLVEEVQTTNEIIPPDLVPETTSTQQDTLKAFFGQQSKVVHRYDEQGHRVETQHDFGPFSSDRKTMAYNERGDQTEESWCHGSSRRFIIDDEGHLTEEAESGSRTSSSSEARFEYQYDSHGNWTERVISGRLGPDQSFVVSSVNRRILTYY